MTDRVASAGSHVHQRNISWAERDRPLPPEMIPHRLFDRLSAARIWLDDRKTHSPLRS